MKISTKGRYGLRALVDLALFSEGGHVSLASIAERQDVSSIYLEQVFAILRKAGFVKSVKGAQGGYLLCEQPKDIVIGRVLRVLEGDLLIIDEVNPPDDNSQTIVYETIKEQVWDRINKEIIDMVDKLTLEDMVSYARQVTVESLPIYYI